MTQKKNISTDEQILGALGMKKDRGMKVPEGYFEGLTERVMAHIEAEHNTPEEEVKAKTVSMKPAERPTWKQVMRWAVAAAACVVMAVVGINYYNKDMKTLAQQELNYQVAGTEAYDDEYGEDMMSYSMMDETDVYCYLAGME